MKKIFAVIGLILHIVSYVLAVNSLLIVQGYKEVKMLNDFHFWVYAIAIAGVAILFYFGDALLALITSRKAINIIKMILVIAAVPMWIEFGGAPYTTELIVWNVFFAVMFIFELVTLFIKWKKPEKE